MNFQGIRIAVAGMGRSGLAIAEAAIARGAVVTVYDEHSPDDSQSADSLDHLHGIGANVITGWHGHLEDTFDILVASPGFRRSHPAICDALDLGKEVISEIEFAHRISVAPIIAITGTNGKSTTTVMTWLLINAAKLQSGFVAGPNKWGDIAPSDLPAILCGNISGTGYPELTLTEAAAVASKDQVLVAEISSYQLEWVKDFHPIAAAITNITPDHLDRHPNFDDYRKTKLRIFDNMNQNDVAVVNESEDSIPLAFIVNAMPPSVGIRSFVDRGARAGVNSGHFTEPTTYRDGDTMRFSGRSIALDELSLGGDHNAINAMMAWELALAFVSPLTEEVANRMLESLANFRGLAHRMELIGERGGIKVFNNSMCTNPRAVISSSNAINAKQHLLMGGNTKNLDFSPVAEFLESSPHQVYIFGQSESPNNLSTAFGDRWPVFPTLEMAFEAVTKAAVAGDVIMLSPGCLSAFPFTNFRERGEVFRKIAKEWLR